jgi:hypothetical protein
MFKFEIRVGRLAEVILASPLTVEEFEGFTTAARLGLLALPGKAIAVLDMTRCTVLSDEVAELAVNLIRRDSPKIERAAYLLPQLRGAASMQLTRMFREAGTEARRIFDDKHVLRAWLAPALTPFELRRLHEFLADVQRGTGSP